MTTQRGWSIIGLLIIALVVSLPIYSANVLAVSVQITKNQGQAAIPQFIDAQDDVWTVEATITGAPQAVTPQDVKIKIGSNEAAFQSCSQTALGTACEYISPLTDGVMEGEYAFQAIYTFLNALGLPESVSNSDVIKADGSGPTIEFKKLQQNAQGQVEIDFSVKDKKTGAPAVGVKTIEILDADSGNVLQTITLPNPGTEQWNYDPDAVFNGILKVQLSGEGLKRIKLRAEDWLGHQSSQNPVKDFQSDFIAPAIKDNLNFPKMGKFIGSSTVVTEMTIDIVETTLREVKASSSEAGLDNTPATECLEDAEQEKLWHCAWEEVEVQPSESISVSILATDHFGNSASKTLSYKLTKDSSAPQIDFFGTERQFEGQSFVRDGKQRIILRVKEQGAGITEEGLRANLLALGKGTSEAPTSCEQTETSFNCVWETSAAGLSGVARIGLSKFEDRVGNQGETPEIELVVDNAGPKVEKLEVLGVSDIGAKDYFQSNDVLKVKLEVVETHGLVILLNLNDVVMDAEAQFPETGTGLTQGLGAGWAAFLEEDVCTREEGKWSCELETPSIKSGPDSEVNLQIRIQDTAGNDAASWPEKARNAKSFKGKNKGEADYDFELLGLSEENNPDFWEVSRGYPLPLLSFVDMDTVKIVPARMPLQIKLKSDNAAVKLLSLEVDDCSPAGESPAPELRRVLLTGGRFSEGTTSPTSTLILEFEPFDGRQLFAVKEGGPFVSPEGKFEQATATYNCQFRLFSQVSKAALRAPEGQEVQVKVPFAFSTLGAPDENIAQRIKEVRESGFMKFADAVAPLNTALQWLQYLTNIFQIIVSVNQLVDVFGEGLIASAKTAETTGVFAKLGLALRGGCVAVQGTQSVSWKWVQGVQRVVQILNCNPSAIDSKIDVIGWYGKYQRTLLDSYNLASGRGALGLPATSLYDNLYLSAAGFCLSGILFNIDKAREIHCRKIICYGREVPAGIATIDACNKLYDLQMCEFVWGPFFDFFLLGGIGQLGRLIQAAFTSPLGLISATETIACGLICFDPTTPGGKLTACKVFTGINRVIAIIDSLVSLKDTRPTVTGSPYCSMAENINVDELAGAGTMPAAPSEEPQPTGGY